MKRKLQALRRRNTDSSLGVTIMKLHGTGLKISHADTQEWAKSFDSLLMDKSKWIYILLHMIELWLRWMGILPWLAAIFTKGSNFCDFLFASLKTR